MTRSIIRCIQLKELGNKILHTQFQNFAKIRALCFVDQTWIDQNGNDISRVEKIAHHGTNGPDIIQVSGKNEKKKGRGIKTETKKNGKSVSHKSPKGSLYWQLLLNKFRLLPDQRVSLKICSLLVWK